MTSKPDTGQRRELVGARKPSPPRAPPQCQLTLRQKASFFHGYTTSSYQPPLPDSN